MLGETAFSALKAPRWRQSGGQLGRSSPSPQVLIKHPFFESQNSVKGRVLLSLGRCFSGGVEGQRLHKRPCAPALPWPLVRARSPSHPPSGPLKSDVGGQERGWAELGPPLAGGGHLPGGSGGGTGGRYLSARRACMAPGSPVPAG